ncbi:MAG: hypothetical protein ACHP7P_03785 [Terriglobales bacterium]
MAQAVRDKLLHDVGEVITEYEAELRREEEFFHRMGLAQGGGLAQRKIGKLIVDACQELAHLAIANERRDPQGWAEAEIRALEAAIAKEYGFALDKTLPAAIASGLHESRVLIVGAVRTVPLSPAHPSPTPTDKGKRHREPSRLSQYRDAVMFLAIKAGKKAMGYCEFIHGHGIHPGPDWVSDGCPKTYPTAYLDKRWRQRINDEKYRAGVRMEKMAPDEVDKLLEEYTRGIRHSSRSLLTSKSSIA